MNKIKDLLNVLRVQLVGHTCYSRRLIVVKVHRNLVSRFNKSGDIELSSRCTACYTDADNDSVSHS